MVVVIMIFAYLLADYRGVPIVGLILFVLIGIYGFVTQRTIVGRSRPAVPGDRRLAATARDRGAGRLPGGRFARASEDGMMDGDVIDETEPGYVLLTRRLAAYADERLSPSSVAVTRMRTAVMSAAHSTGCTDARGRAIRSGRGHDVDARR